MARYYEVFRVFPLSVVSVHMMSDIKLLHVHAAVSLESRGMLQLQPGERKVIKAAGEVDISTKYLRMYLSIYAGRVRVRVVPAPRAQQQPGLGTQGPRHRPDGGHLHTAGGQV